MENPFEKINERLDRIEKLLESCVNGDNGNSRVMNLKQLSEYLGLSISHLYKLTSREDIPFSKRGKKLYFDRQVIDNWT